MNTGICRDCAELAVSGIKRFLKVRSFIGASFILAVFLLIPAVNALLGFGEIILIPINNGLIVIDVWTFDDVAALRVGGFILLMMICFFLAFIKRVNFESISELLKDKLEDKSKDDYRIYTVTVDSSRIGSFDGAGRIGVLLIELLISFISGPFFFIHGFYKLRQLSIYIKE